MDNKEKWDEIIWMLAEIHNRLGEISAYMGYFIEYSTGKDHLEIKSEHFESYDGVHNTLSYY